MIMCKSWGPRACWLKLRLPVIGTVIQASVYARQYLTVDLSIVSGGEGGGKFVVGNSLSLSTLKLVANGGEGGLYLS